MSALAGFAQDAVTGFLFCASGCTFGIAALCIPARNWPAMAGWGAAGVILGKSVQELVWAQNVHQRTGLPDEAPADLEAL